MCGRYVTVKSIQEIEKRYNVTANMLKHFTGNINVSVGQYAPVITNKDPKQLQLFQFGLTPHWAKKKMYLFNARSEGDFNKDNDPTYTGAKGILQKPSFRKPIRSQRCLVVADAFIEGSKEKRLNEPFLIYPRDPEGQFSIAGIWDEWADPETGEITGSFSIITTTANDLLQRVGHHRSPVLLEGEEESLWLNSDTDIADISGLLKPFDAKNFNAYPISSEIKSPKAVDSTLLAPIGPTVYPEFTYVIYENLKLFGMGESPARERRAKEDEEGD
jgi:putative SOS response-associated peptidase YedK